ncbi:unnamed protein product [Dicrocoelium dendriticum]|nr:unnamed protein product [Dicrocoelium dendriticum]
MKVFLLGLVLVVQVLQTMAAIPERQNAVNPYARNAEDPADEARGPYAPGHRRVSRQNAVNPYARNA